ncbi:MAG: HD domain-containing protein [Muribaculaceae bacterium]
MEQPSMTVTQEVTDYVEREIIPHYTAFDKAHREDHVRMVIRQSLRLAAHFPALNTDMVYVVAAFHDLGLAYGRENHHRDSRKILESDAFVCAHFTPAQIRTMGEAVEDHRASGGHRPRNEYGLIVAEADRHIDPETIIRRTVQYGLAHYPDLDRESHRQRAIRHLHEKYGPDGYLRVWLPFSDNARNLRRLHALLADQPRLNGIFERIFDEEAGEQKVGN